MSHGPAHVALAAFDVENSGDPSKTDDILRATRSALLETLRDAADRAAISWSRCVWRDQGDGGTLIAPADYEFRIVDPFTGHLAAGLRRHNRRSSPPARIRLRMAVHSGPVSYDQTGVSGTPLVHLARLLDSLPLRAQLAASPGDLALIVSDPLYNNIVRHDYGLLDPAAFHQVPVRVKETTTYAWILAVAGGSIPPAPPTPREALDPVVPVSSAHRVPRLPRCP
jgi:class 3 adenylate cyclase